MTEQDNNVALVQGIYEKFGQGNIAGVMAALAEDAVFELYGPDVIPTAGSYRGHEEIARFFQIVAETGEVEAFEPVEFIAQSETVVVLGRERVTARSTGKGWATEWAMAWTVRDGKVVHLREYHNTAEIAAAFS